MYDLSRRNTDYKWNTMAPVSPKTNHKSGIMRILMILMLLGYGSATLLESFQREARGAVQAFIDGLQKSTPLHVALGIENSPDVQRIERDLKEDLKKHIRDAFEKALQRIIEANEIGGNINQEALKQLQDLREKMKDLDIDEETVKDGIEELKKKVDDHLRNILEKMGIIDKRFAETDTFNSVISDLSIRDMLIKLKNMILEKMNVGSMKQALAKVVGQSTQKLCEWLTNKGKEKVMNLFDRILESDDEESEVDKRYADDRVQEIRKYLENIEEDAENKVSKFKGWLHELISSGLDEAREKIEKITAILKEIITRSQKLSKENIKAILEYLRQYEEEFSSISNLRDIIAKILNKTH